jgi:CubicO group peptidase (beta-lactamase class C family)
VRHPLAIAVVFLLYVCVAVHHAQLRGADAVDAAPAASRPLPSLVFPGDNWISLPPQMLALDERKLNALSDYVGGVGCVVRNGYLAYTWGDAAKRIDIASACKPWYTHFLFQAIENGKVKSLDEPLVSLEPGLVQLNGALGHKDRKILWRHLVSQTSCYGVTERPGTAFDYSDYNMALLFDNLFLKVHGATLENATVDVLHKRLTDLIGCQDSPRFNGKGRLAVSPRDCARFALLYLREGNWNGKQLLSPEHVRTILTSPVENSVPRTAGKPAEMLPNQRSIGGGSNQTDHYGSYSFTWWINGVDRNGRRHWPAAPANTFGAFGHKGKRAFVVIPEDELIVVWNEAKIESPEMENRALQLLLDARRLEAAAARPAEHQETNTEKRIRRIAEPGSPPE